MLAGAGSGKTTVLTRRVARLLARGTDPQRIFVATFTKKAVEEMGSRLASHLGEGGEAIDDTPCSSMNKVMATVPYSFVNLIG